jgi:hypothetical protein
MLAAGLVLLAAGCDRQGRPIEHIGMDRLKPGVSTEAEVIQVFGPPDRIVGLTGGTRVLQFPMGPEGPRTFFAQLGSDGRLVEVHNVLTADQFARIVPGMGEEEVRLLLGRPGRQTPYPLQKQVAWSWKYVDGPNTRRFVAHFDDTGRVVTAGTEADPLEGGR